MKRILILVMALSTPAVYGQEARPLPGGVPTSVSIALPAREAPPVYTYAAKFVCGPVPQSTFVVAGTYLSTTNVHNPSMWEVATGRKKFAVALPGEKVGKISKYIPVTLRADEAMQIDCRNISEHLGMSPGQFIEGFTVIESSIELDVVTVYTGGSGAVPQLTTMHTERAPVRVARGCPRADIPLTTGTATWSIVERNNAAVSPAAPTFPFSPQHPWISGSRPPMISSAASGIDGETTFVYETCFCLCAGGGTLKLTDLIADNIAQVFVNGTAVGTAVDSSSTATWATAAQLAAINSAGSARLVAGQNCLRVRVTNRDDESETGLALRGSVSGQICPR